MDRTHAGPLIQTLDTLRKHLDLIVRAAIGAADGGRLTARALSDPAIRAILGERPLTVIAAGKVAVPMARSIVAGFPRRVERGLVTTMGPAAGDIGPLTAIRAQHPTPGEGSLAAGRLALQLARETGSEGCLLVLLSGGASSMLSLPFDDVPLVDKARATELLMKAGAEITTLNVVRKHLSRIKGGRLAAASAARTLGLAISDVVGDDVAVIGSGPTVGDPSTFADALEALAVFAVTRTVPDSVRAALERGARGDLAETPKPGAASLARAAMKLIGSLEDALNAADAEARRLGYSVVRLGHPVVGEARAAGARYLGDIAPILRRVPRPACLLSGGETTVRVRGRGRGGRNQELALAAAGSLEHLGRAVLASVGTDGIDGPTDAAGARADWTTLDRARRKGLAPPDAVLDENDSYAYFDELGDLIVTGATNANVGDLQVVLVDE